MLYSTTAKKSGTTNLAVQLRALKPNATRAVIDAPEMIDERVNPSLPSKA
jgi:hypothetical protein